jgi:predicted glycoside hydrolase/deacetylase ChbG (UPF0249 family)
MELTINADDLGWGPPRDAGVLLALERGLCDSASIMPTGVGFEAACEAVHRLKLAGRVGMHFVMTEGKPLTDCIRHEKRLCDDEGMFVDRQRRIWMLSTSEASAVAEEMRAQLDACRRYGLPIHHVDSHSHSHEEWAVMEIVIAITKEHCIPAIRIARNCGRSTGIAKAVYRRMVNSRLRNAGLARTDFFGSWQDVVFSRHRWLRTRGHVEAMVHPVLNEQGVIDDLMSSRSLTEIHAALVAACGPGDQVPAPHAHRASPSEIQTCDRSLGVSAVSVIVPCYNGAALVRRCLDSVFAQTLKPGEVIVVNDGSTDNSAQIVAEYGSRVRYFEQTNQGPATARNVGFRMATGKYVAMLDADDYWLPEFLRRCVGFLESCPDALAVSVGWKVKTWGHKECVRPAFLAEELRFKPKGPRILEEFFGFWGAHNHITPGSNVIRKAAFDQVGQMRSDLRICEDVEFWGYLATFGTWGFIPEVLYVNDGTAVEAAQGWLNKHRLRWRNCPTVEQWQERIAPRLRDEDWPGFRVMRGRIARMVAHNKILAAEDREARRVVREFGAAFPKDKLGLLLRAGSSLGPLGWKLCAFLLRRREEFKALMLAATTRRSAKSGTRGSS